MNNFMANPPSFHDFLKEENIPNASKLEEMCKDPNIQKMLDSIAHVSEPSAKEKLLMKMQRNKMLYGSYFPSSSGKASIINILYIKELLEAMVADKDITEEQANNYLLNITENIDIVD